MNTPRLSLALMLCFSFPCFASAAPAAAESKLYSIPATTIEGKKTNLKAFESKVLLLVNTASQCGFTSQYEGLQKLALNYRSRGFEVLGFPSNDFGGQEPGTNAEIKQFCQQKFHVDFPLFEKGPVTGPLQQPIYTWLLANAPSQEPIAWNFEKFLISRSGQVLARFKSSIAPDDSKLTQAIEAALQDKAKR